MKGRVDKLRGMETHLVLDKIKTTVSQIDRRLFISSRIKKDEIQGSEMSP